MEGEYLTSGVREACLFLLSSEDPKAAAAILRKCAPFQPSASTLQELLKTAGEAIEAQEDSLYEDMLAEETVPDDACALAVSMDGANVLLRDKGGKMGRPRQRPGGDETTESASAYRNAMVGTVSFYGKVPEGKKSPERLSGRAVARMPEKGAAHFKQVFEREVSHALEQIPSDMAKVAVCDGARGIWTYLRSNALFSDFIMVVDYYHAMEHLSLASETIFGKSSEEGKQWFKSWRKRMLVQEGAVTGLLRSMDYYKKSRKLGKAALKALATQGGYFQRNQDRMNYAELRKRGLPIGSGPVEAACKVVVKQRLCRSGQRWLIEGGQHVLHLRSIVQSGRWERFWQRFEMSQLAA